MKKDEKEELKKGLINNIKEPTLTEVKSVKLTKTQRFLSLFKQTDVSLKQLNRLLIYVAIIAFAESVLVIKFLPINFALALVMLGNIIPFKLENIKTSAWRMLYVTVPVTILGLLLNYFVFGLQSTIISIVILFAMTFITAVVHLLSLLITGKFKEHIFNFLLYGLSTAIQFVFYAVLMNIK